MVAAYASSSFPRIDGVLFVAGLFSCKNKKKKIIHVVS